MKRFDLIKASKQLKHKPQVDANGRPLHEIIRLSVVNSKNGEYSSWMVTRGTGGTGHRIDAVSSYMVKQGQYHGRCSIYDETEKFERALKRIEQYGRRLEGEYGNMVRFEAYDYYGIVRNLQE